MNDDWSLITCILYQGGAAALVQSLRERGVTSVQMHHARGSAVGASIDRRGRPIEFDQEVVNVVVPAAQADELFEHIFFEAGIDGAQCGFMYMARLRRCSRFTLPDLPAEEPV